MVKNHITLIGNIGTDPRVTNFENGSKITRFQLASDKIYRANNGKMKSDREWHNCFAFGSLARYLEKFAEKGKKVAIHGRLITRTYFAQDGKRRNITEVELKHIIGL